MTKKLRLFTFVFDNNGSTVTKYIVAPSFVRANSELIARYGVKPLIRLESRLLAS